MFPKGWVLDLWLPSFVIRVCCFFQILWIKNYVASSYILACIYLFYTLVKKCSVSVLVPTVLILWKILLVVCPWLWKSFLILLCWTITVTWWLLRYAWKHPGRALLRLCHWGYYVWVMLVQKDACNIILRAIQYQLFFTLVMSFLNWLEALMRKVIVKALQFLFYVRSNWGPIYSVEACCSSVLPSGGLPLCQRFPGPKSPTIFFHSFSFLWVHVNMEKRSRHCHLGVSGLILGKKYYSKIKGKKSVPQFFGHDLIHKVKITFAIYFLLYLFNTFPFLKIIK